MNEINTIITLELVHRLLLERDYGAPALER